MIQNKLQLILASASPRRKDLLSFLYGNFKIIPSTIDEVSNEKEPGKLVEDLAFQKMNDVKNNLENDFCIIASDTIVYHDNQVLGKPKDRLEAEKMLRSMSGSVHQVYTGVTIATKENNYSFHECTNVHFNIINEELLQSYLDSGDSLDKAGAYGIQSSAIAFIKKIDGCYANVVGLPVNRLLSEVKTFLNIKENEQLKWKEYFL